MKNRYCEMCDKWFPMLRTVWCPLCGNLTRPAEKTDIAKSTGRKS